MRCGQGRLLCRCAPGRRAAPGAGGAASADVAALQVALRGVGLYEQTIDGVGRARHARGRAPLPGAQGPRRRRCGGRCDQGRSGRRGGPSYGSRTLSRGHSGWDVAALQFRLAWRGFPSGTFDGGFGSHLEAAVRRFQA